MIPSTKKYSDDTSEYTQTSVRRRIEALFLNNIGLVVTRQQIIRAATDPDTGQEPENWHQRLSELRTDRGYTILSLRDWTKLAPQEYVMPSADRKPTAGKRVRPTRKCWTAVLDRADGRCEWTEDGVPCLLTEGETDPVGGGTVKLTPDHQKPHSIDPNADPSDPDQWQVLCARHQVMKKNYWDGTTGKLNVLGILQNIGKKQKEEALDFLLQYFGLQIVESENEND